MGITKDYLKYAFSGVCNVVGSNNGMVQNVDRITCATIAGNAVNFYNMRTLEMIKSLRRDDFSTFVTAFKINRQKTLIIIGFENGEIDMHRLDSEASQKPAKYVGHKSGVSSLTFNKDGLVFASGGKDCSIVIWDTVNESGLFKLNGHKGPITQLQFTKDDRYLISSSKDSHIKFWCLESKESFYTISESVTEISSFVLTREDRILIVGSAEVELIIFELTWLESFEDYSNLEDLSDSFLQIHVNPKRNTLIGSNYITECSDQANTVLRIKKRGTLIRQAKGRATHLCLSDDESLMCCIGTDNSMDIYQIFNEDESEKRFKKKLRKMQQRSESKLIQSADSELNEPDQLEGKEVAKDVTILVTRIGNYTADAKLINADFCNAYISPSENLREYRLYCLLKSNDIYGVSLKVNWKSSQIDEANTLVSLGKMRGHRTDVRTLASSSDGSMFVSASQESAIVWDFSTLLPMNILSEKRVKMISSCLFLTENKYILLGTMDGSIFIFDIAKNEMIENLENAHHGAILKAIGASKNNRFITCGADKKARFWSNDLVEIENNKTILIKSQRVLELPDEALDAVISPNEKFVVFALLDNTARVYYLDTLKFFVSLYGHSLPVYCVDISPDNKLVVTGSGDKSAKIWGLDFGDCHKSLFAHDDAVVSVKFCKNSEDRLFWTAGKDGKLKQWNAVKFILVQTISAHTAPIRALIITPLDDALISAANDRAIHLWELTDEIIVHQEEEEKEREKEHDQKLLEMEDIIPGESRETNTQLAAIKTIESIKSVEDLIDAVDIIRRDKLEHQEDANCPPHPLLATYPRDSYHKFLADMVQKIRPSHLEKSLLLVPLSYIADILHNLCRCVKENYKHELACRVILFILKIHHNQIKNSIEFLHQIDELRNILPSKLSELLDQTGFNLAALKFLQTCIEERSKTKLFRNVSAVEREKTEKKEKIKRQKAKDFAVVKI